MTCIACKRPIHVDDMASRYYCDECMCREHERAEFIETVSWLVILVTGIALMASALFWIPRLVMLWL